MNRTIVDSIKDMTREEWVMWQWERVQTVGKPDQLVRTYRRLPDEVGKAVEDWEAYEKETKK